MTSTTGGAGTPTTPAEVVAVIPARAGSRRLPRKPLLDLGGAPLVWRVYERVRACAAIDAVFVATDDAAIADAVTARGGHALRVDAPCASGTERVARAAARLDAPLVLNVQGDEPFVEPGDLAAVVAALRAGAAIATLAAPLPAGLRDDAATVKVVRDAAGGALYFSRHPIPGEQHVGVYGFRRDALLAVARLPRGRLAAAEDLEQLAWLEAGWRIDVRDVPAAPRSIDTPADLAAARTHFTTARAPA